ncbi:16S rRNA (adenine(1518)-N(6)/adenine(1519)-N(6))-dimethyltransferase RsmA [Rhodohalobacter barkolensis]|uniref:Ribosomal RNA small subunit methyltransferase A n=1 Tax=Rhodohalobacter barkolensis TaxID=2053187 RepID=A0A2N0VFU8_9BACT|nr:16S rRNA (adenine(1518)-N(6)/adenine(1519)-N(6))-dimethyltransferase RsmA [Rhodohalobacter barkolensis]PKD43065.1 ribosomal RNA small subunit methyltransferase A [Rhodohalobacter barkolensis]
MANHPRTKKSLGQHFLKDPNMIRKIVDSIPAQKSDRIVEIGPGAGAITGLILQEYDDVVAVEIDQRMVEHLSAEHPNLKIVHGDILKSDWSEFVVADKPVHVVGNLPYYITSQILFKVLEYRKHIQSALLMMQKEVAERIVADPRSKEYGILSVQTQLMSSPVILFDVPPGVFSPPPNVNSAVLKLTFDRPDMTCSDKNLKTVVRMAFNQRRKKLSNALRRLDAELPEDEFDFNLRAEALTPDMYEKLTARLEQLGTFS